MIKESKKGSEASWWSAPMQMFLRISGWIALPLILTLFLGKWLDEKFGTAPWIMLALTGLAFLISMFGIIITATKEFKKIEDENQKNKENKNK